MWKLFQRNQELRGMVEISAADLSALLGPLFSKLIILDLRRKDEVEHYPYIIPGALLTTKVDAPALITWLPLRSWVVLYATDHMPGSYSRLDLLRNDLSLYLLSASLRLGGAPALRWRRYPSTQAYELGISPPSRLTGVERT